MSTTSAYTPPLQDNMEKRHSRSTTRDNSKRRRYDKSQSEHTRLIRERDRSRHLSHYRKSVDSSSYSSDEDYRKTKRRKSRSHKRISRNEISRKRYRSRSRSSDNNTFFRKFAKLINNNKRSTFEGAHNVIPEFDPDANSQTAADWLRKVNETAAIYKWNEKQIIYYAIPKLSGYARKWYQGQSTLNLSWRQWQRKIIKTFPDDRNYADRLYEMLERKSKREESLEEYFHDKARLVKMCGISGRNAVDCIHSWYIR
ncbi:unnamed protein product [Euphydryas editha]|uniref:Retrotransposon gag domain-containing protein n=1 Tax=Euphydryas editha TaxID=104508 RepID=A0AAU9VCI8_EUPED|nr:unnamed protein product [Euphydryas editha]